MLSLIQPLGGDTVHWIVMQSEASCNGYPLPAASYLLLDSGCFGLLLALLLAKPIPWLLMYLSAAAAIPCRHSVIASLVTFVRSYPLPWLHV